MSTPTITPKVLRLSSSATAPRVNPAVEAIKAMSSEDLHRALGERRGRSAHQREADQRMRAQTAAKAKASRLASLGR